MHKKALSLFTLSLLSSSAVEASEKAQKQQVKRDKWRIQQAGSLVSDAAQAGTVECIVANPPSNSLDSSREKVASEEPSIIQTQPSASATPLAVLVSLHAATVEPLAGAPAFPLAKSSPRSIEIPEAEVFETVTETDFVSDAELEEKAQITFFNSLLSKKPEELSTWLDSNDAATMRTLFKNLDAIIRNTDKTIASALTQFESDKKILIDARSKQKRQMQQCAALQEKLKNLQETLKSEQSSLTSLAHAATLAEQQAGRSQDAFNKDNEERTQLVSLYKIMAEEVKSQAGPCKDKFDLAQQLEAGKSGFEVVEHEDGPTGKQPAQEESTLTKLRSGFLYWLSIRD